MAPASTAAPAPWPSATIATTQWPSAYAPATPRPGSKSTPGYGGGQFGSNRPPQNGLGTAALVLGIIGMVVPYGCIFGALGIIFGAIGISRANAGRANNKGVATAGLILGIVGFVLWTLISLVWSGL